MNELLSLEDIQDITPDCWFGIILWIAEHKAVFFQEEDHLWTVRWTSDGGKRWHFDEHPDLMCLIDGAMRDEPSPYWHPSPLRNEVGA